MTAVALSLFLLLGAGAVSTNDRAFWEVRIELTEEARRELSSEPRQPVNARVQFGRGQLLAAQVKLKGHGSFQRLNQKPSFTLQFDPAFASKVPFSNRRIHLNNSVEDTSYLKEKIGAELFFRAGIAAPHVAHARVRLNEKELGLYVLKEGFSEEFMSRSFGNTNGAIYDMDSSAQKEDVEQVDVDAGDGAPGKLKLNELWNAASEVDLNKRFDRLDQVLDNEDFLKFIAVEVMLCHWDGYALNENNFRIYLPDNGKIQFLPSGMDQIFAKADLAWKPRFSGKVARALMETESADERYEAIFKALLPQVLDAQQMSNRLNEVVREISPHLSREEMGVVRSGTKELIAGIAARSERLRQQLQTTEPMVVSFTGGSAVIHGWEAAGNPAGGKMTQTASNLVILAGPKTSASWRTQLRLPAGGYRFTAQVETRDLVPMPFGNRQGACLRVLGKDTQSKSITGTSSETLQCEFEVSENELVVLVCELRAAGGQVRFGKPILLRQL